MNNINIFKQLFIATCTALFSSLTWADETIKISPLERVDEIYLEHKRESVTDLSFKRLSKIIYGDKRDLTTMQLLLDQEIVNAANEQELFAMGVLLGDIYVKEFQLEWRVYLDQIGKSRAVCIPKSSNCLFPITMVSKRLKRDVKVDIKKLYARGVDLIDDHFPKLPYAVDK